ncbi:MAG: HAD-IIB family hydrolase [Clostridia bacterium]|nr:HAD-IIB family hydrolase [Clostridia bacterium]
MRYKVIATDFDGTLLTSSKTISDVNKEALKKCKDGGFILVGITARNLSSIRSVCDISMFDYLVINNGTYIYDVKNNTGEYIQYLERNLIEDITKKFIKSSEGIDYCTIDKYFSYKTKILVKRPFQLNIKDISEIDGIVARINIWADSNEKIYSFKQYVDEKYPDVDTITMLDTDAKSNKKWLAINPKGCSKATTLKAFADKINVDMGEIIFFGDATNDVDLIKQAGLGVAMGNAIPEVKSQAKDVTLTNDQDGVGVYLNKIVDLLTI